MDADHCATNNAQRDQGLWDRGGVRGAALGEDARVGLALLVLKKKIKVSFLSGTSLQGPKVLWYPNKGQGQWCLRGHWVLEVLPMVGLPVNRGYHVIPVGQGPQIIRSSSSMQFGQSPVIGANQYSTHNLSKKTKSRQTNRSRTM